MGKSLRYRAMGLEVVVDRVTIDSARSQAGYSRSQFYRVLNELQIVPIREGRYSYIRSQDVERVKNYRILSEEHDQKQAKNFLTVKEPEVQSLPEPVMNADFTRFEMLDKVCQHGWWLTTTQISVLTGIPRSWFRGKVRYAMGFTFERKLRLGHEYQWEVKR